MPSLSVGGISTADSEGRILVMTAVIGAGLAGLTAAYGSDQR
jgi:hypothetical protein